MDGCRILHRRQRGHPDESRVDLYPPKKGVVILFFKAELKFARRGLYLKRNEYKPLFPVKEVLLYGKGYRM